jgi:hypothetical protein
MISSWIICLSYYSTEFLNPNEIRTGSPVDSLNGDPVLLLQHTKDVDQRLAIVGLIHAVKRLLTFTAPSNDNRIDGIRNPALYTSIYNFNNFDFTI